MYMGELVRQVLVDMVWEELMFNDLDTDNLFVKGAFLSKYVSKIEADPVGDYTKCRKVNKILKYLILGSKIRKELLLKSIFFFPTYS